MDVLSDILNSLRLSGGVVIDGEFTGDFCVHAEFTPAHFAPFFPQPKTLISYHYVRSGQMMVRVEEGSPVAIGAGSIAILPRNHPHTLCSREDVPPAEVGDIIWITKEGVHRVTTGSPGERSEIWCGFLGCDQPRAHPILEALPSLLVLNVRDGEAQWLDSSMRFMAREKPSSDVVARLAELFLTQAIREYIASLSPESAGWLRALADPAVARALALIHQRYAEELELDEIARHAGVSRSVLGERFAELLGEPPMRYCARWRMRRAADLLRDSRDNTASVAFAVGFTSEAAFSRAFKREYGVPPAAWRRRAVAEAPGVN